MQVNGSDTVLHEHRTTLNGRFSRLELPLWGSDPAIQATETTRSGCQIDPARRAARMHARQLRSGRLDLDAVCCRSE